MMPMPESIAVSRYQMRILSVFSFLVFLAACSTDVPNLPPGPSAALVPQSYLVQPGDTLDVKFVKNPELNEQPTVAPDGRISMIYGFAKQVGGHVRIISEVERGTSVLLYMPRSQAARSDMPQRAGGEAPAGAGETVLVVEDDPSVRMLIMDILAELGYAAIEAYDSQSALPALESRRRIDLLVTDVGLPGGMNGRQLAERARQLRPGLRTLFITGYAEGAAIR